MNLSEKILYQQIHPLKLGTDIGAALASLWFFWQHKLLLGLFVHFAPPIIVSLIVVYGVDLEPQRQSAFGRYVKRMMTNRVDAIRFGGDVVMVLGAWHRSLPAIAMGIAIVISCWLSGLTAKKSP